MPCDMALVPIREGPCGLRLTIPGEAGSVTDGLRALFSAQPLQSLPADGKGTAEIVLAEVLNNIVEHAYARHSGEIEVTLSRDAGGLLVQVVDTGLPMPDGTPPPGGLPALGAEEDLPEGGFGWHLIRTLSRDLEYRRDGARNLLRFRLEG